jgi:hypothetical protein
MAALKRVVPLTPEPVVRFAVVMFQAASLSESPARFISGLRVGREAAELVLDLLELAPLQPDGSDPELLLRTAKRLRLKARPRRFEACVLAGRALWPDTMHKVARGLGLAVKVISEVSVRELKDQGLEGAALGAALHARQLEKLSRRLIEESC